MNLNLCTKNNLILEDILNQIGDITIEIRHFITLNGTKTDHFLSFAKWQDNVLIADDIDLSIYCEIDDYEISESMKHEPILKIWI